MKRRYLQVLILLLILSALFSIPVSAAAEEISADTVSETEYTDDSFSETDIISEADDMPAEAEVQTGVILDEAVASISLCAFGEGLVQEQGHAFLYIENLSSRTLDILSYPLKPGAFMTLGLWPDSIVEFGGVHINQELVNGTYAETCTWLSTLITSSDLKKLTNYSLQESYYHDGTADSDDMDFHDDLWHNCTTYAIRAWNKVCPEIYTISESAVDIDAPLWLKKKLRDFSGCKEGKFLECLPVSTADELGSLIHLTDVYYVTPDGDMIPETVDDPQMAANRTKKDGQAIRVTWKNVSRKLLNGQTNFTSYILTYRYKNSNGKKKSESITINDLSTTSYRLKNLKPHTEYSIELNIVCEKGNYFAITQGIKVKVKTTNSLVLSQKKLTIYKGECKTLTAKFKSLKTKPKWSSSNRKIATVNFRGKIKGIKKGTCTITATYKGRKARCKVTVKNLKTDAALGRYRKLLTRQSISGMYSGSTITLKNASFALIYLDNDKIPELVVRNTVSGHPILVFSCKNGSITEEIAIEDSQTGFSSYYPYTKVFVTMSAHANIYVSSHQYSYCTYNQSASQTGFETGTELFGKGKYTASKTGKTLGYTTGTSYYSLPDYAALSKSAFGKKLRKKVGSAKNTKIVWHKNTASNRSKYL